MSINALFTCERCWSQYSTITEANQCAENDDAQENNINFLVDMAPKMISILYDLEIHLPSVIANTKFLYNISTMNTLLNRIRLVLTEVDNKYNGPINNY